MTDQPRPFDGFSRPTYTPIPDELFDVLLPELSKPELKVLLYVMRRTFGFKKDADAISTAQLVSGITTKDGRVLDRGTGLPRSSVKTATQSLVERGILTVRQVRSETGDYESNVYSVRFKEVGQSVDHPQPEVVQPVAHPWPASDPPVGQPLDPQETVNNIAVNNNGSGAKTIPTEAPDPTVSAHPDPRAMTLEERIAWTEERERKRKVIARAERAMTGSG